jgi:uncharacterized protein (DUF1330 family)
MAAYIIAEVEVTDPEAYAEYRARVPAVIAAHGGKYLARGGQTETIEGDGAPGRLVILEFPDMAAARGFANAPEYAPLAAIRQKASRSRLILVEGYAG